MTFDGSGRRSPARGTTEFRPSAPGSPPARPQGACLLRSVSNETPKEKLKSQLQSLEERNVELETTVRKRTNELPSKPANR